MCPAGSGAPVPALARVGKQAVRARHRVDLAELDARLVGLEPGCGPREPDHADRPLPALEEPQGALDLGGAERAPPSAQADKRLLRGGELGELLRGQLDVPDREAPVGTDAIASRVRMPLDGARRGRGDEVDADAARRRHPLPGQAHRDAELLQAREPPA